MKNLLKNPAKGWVHKRRYTHAHEHRRKVLIIITDQDTVKWKHRKFSYTSTEMPKIKQRLKFPYIWNKVRYTTYL
jgi:hypothetical protein